MKENRGIIIPIRVNDEEFDIIKRLSRKIGLSMSATLRNAALEKAEERGILPKEKPVK
ncbi:DUF6290 family protein [Edaphobacter paludis]|uniref:DUF6290 family protein n=1 Tax=Edaphobacter paludis TaxID=3035702 RepID=A0AAU7D854_9BACT